MASSLARVNGGVVVPGCLRDSSFPVGSAFKAVLDSGKIRIGATLTGLAGAMEAHVTDKHTLPIPKSLLADAQIVPGCVVVFESCGDGDWLLRSEPQESFPEFDFDVQGPDGKPLPPEWLIQAFSSVPSQTHYLRSGVRTWEWLSSQVSDAGFKLATGATILDFGCGSGRVLRNIDDKKYRIFGCDLHGPAIKWCQVAFPRSEFVHGFNTPPTTFASQSIDLCYAISVLTHLDEDMQHAWLDEWRRIIKPGGFVLATFNGEDFVENNLSQEVKYYEAIQEQFNSGGIAFIGGNGWQGVFPEFYQTAYHKIDYVEKVWGEYFEILNLVPSGGFVNRQNVAIMRRR